jgi:hypothetical protein
MSSVARWMLLVSFVLINCTNRSNVPASSIITPDSTTVCVPLFIRHKPLNLTELFVTQVQIRRAKMNSIMPFDLL